MGVTKPFKFMGFGAMDVTKPYTAADMTTRCAFKIEDPSRGPGRVDFRGPDEGFGVEGTPKPKIQRDPPFKKGNLILTIA
jgi:hypothetical protein